MSNLKRNQLKPALAVTLPLVFAIAGCGGDGDDGTKVAGPLPDLAVGNIVVSPARPVPTETVDITAEVYNQGEVATPLTVPVRISVDGTTLETVSVAQLEPNSSATAEFMPAGPFEAGGHTIEVTVDPDGGIDETSEDNNTTSSSLGVVRQPSLELNTPVTVSSSTVSEVLLFRVDIAEPSDEPLNIVLSGGSGDADLFVHYGDRPRHTDHYRCNSGNQDTNESCQMVPTRVGTYHVGVLAFSAFGPSNLVATVGGRPVNTFDIELVFLDNGTPSQDSIVSQAAARWESVMGREVQDWPYFQESEGAFGANECFSGQPAVSDLIDDIRIWVSIDSIDGVGDVVGSAGPCHVRAVEYGFDPIISTPTLGAIILDEADVEQLESQGSLLSVVTHELAHVLGFGTIWNIRGWLQDPSVPLDPDADTHFIGPLTIPAFDAVGGGAYAGAKVPVENGGEQGTGDTHWRESVFGDELMTPYLTGDTQPLSLVTVESMYDIWYEVDLNAADAFTLPSAGRAGMAMPSGPFIDLSNDVADWPIVVGDHRTGRVVKVIRPRKDIR
ncbi:MAG: pre-peptidase C-terminal domain-containing protein [Acidobacteriota bacterium]|nr:pre-peptidase C-terminal domain-containing protein [Acidobacteriota bacterium]